MNRSVVIDAKLMRGATAL